MAVSGGGSGSLIRGGGFAPSHAPDGRRFIVLVGGRRNGIGQ